MKKVILFLFFATSLYSWQFHFESGLGGAYRQDRFEHTFKDNLGRPTYHVVYKNLHMGQIQGYATGRYGWLFARFDGDVAWIGSGKAVYTPGIPDVLGGITFFTSESSVSGSAFDILGTGGISFPLVNTQDHQLEFSPFGSYELRHLKLKHGTPNPQQFIVTLPLLPVPLDFGLDPSDLKTNWWGPYAGFELAWTLFTHWTLTGSYAYHWQNYGLDVIVAFPSNLVGIANTDSVNISTSDSKLHSGGFGQTYKGSLTYRGDIWFCTLFGTYLNFRTKVKDVRIRTETVGFQISPGPRVVFSTNKYKYNWENFTVGLQTGVYF